MNAKLWEFSLLYIFNYVYKEPLIQFQELTDEEIEAIKEYRPRTPVEHFPEDFPDETGYDGQTLELYRGIFFTTKEEYDTFLESIQNGTLKNETITSWSYSEHIAEGFAKGAGFYSYTKDILLKGYKGIILKAESIKKEDIFFSPNEASFDLEETYVEFFKDRVSAKIYHSGEEEVVLLPGEYTIKIHRQIDL